MGKNLNDLESLMFQALLEHHRTHFSSEWYYLRALRSPCGFSEPSQKSFALRAMLKEFGIARGLKGSKEKKEGPGVVSLKELLEGGSLRGHVSGFWSENEWKKFFKIAQDENMGQRNLITPKNRSFASGLTKVLWFVYGHKYPMFDRFTKAATDTKGTGSYSQALSFLSKFDTAEYRSTHNDCSAAVEDLRISGGLNWSPQPERVFDKALMFKGGRKLNVPPGMLSDNSNLGRYASMVDNSKALRALAVRFAKCVHDRRLKEMLN